LHHFHTEKKGMTKAEAAAKAMAASPVFKPEKVLKDCDVWTHLSCLIEILTNKVENFTVP
jgi:hypothetical protein